MRLLSLLAIALLVPTAQAAEPRAAPTVEASTRPAPTTGAPMSERLERARAWDLSEAEYRRYERLRVVDAAFSSADVTPYEVLGKYAESAAERRRYARRFRERYLDNRRRAAEWMIAVAEAGEEAPPDAFAMIDASETIRNLLAANGLSREDFAPEPLADRSAGGDDRVRYFLTTDCGERCESELDTLLTQQLLGTYPGVDLVFTDTRDTPTDRQRIRAWAARHALAPALVASRALTLNFDAPKHRALRGDRSPPIALTADGREVRW